MSSPIFIGYPTVEELVQAVKPNATAYTLSLTRDLPGTSGIIRHQEIIAVQFVEGTTVHYCRFRVGTYETLCGSPFGEVSAQEVAARAAGAFRIVQHYLTEQGCTVKPGVVAVPKDLSLLEGGADFLGYNRETRQFFRK